MPTVTAALGVTTTVNIASYIVDDEGNPISVTLTSTLSGVTSTFPSAMFTQPTSTTISINPSSPGNVGETHTITVKIGDGYPLYSTAAFDVNIVKSTSNSAPTFSSAPPAVSRPYSSASLTIPLSTYFSDPNGDTLTMTATYALGTSTPLSIPGGIFSKPTSYEIAVTPSSVS